MLEQQGYTPDSVLPKDVKVDLRRNLTFLLEEIPLMSQK